jgi:nicotinamidase/pyrazinamidase
MSRVLIVVDVQKDFLPGGALGVTDGFAVLPEIVKLKDESYDHVALTRDYHPENHISFSDNPKFEDKSWPPHCVQGTPGSEIHPEILEAFPDAVIFSKGMDPDVEQYSGWNAVDPTGDTLEDWLWSIEATDVDVVGLATDFCAGGTAWDLVHDGLITALIVNATRPVTWAGGARMIYDLALQGVEIK